MRHRNDRRRERYLAIVWGPAADAGTRARYAGEARYAAATRAHDADFGGRTLRVAHEGDPATIGYDIGGYFVGRSVGTIFVHL